MDNKGMIDKVITPVILIITVVFFGIILYVSVFHGIESDTTLNRQKYEQEYGELLVHSLFAAQENDSSMTYEVMMVRALREVNTTIEANNRTIDVKRKYSDALDKLVGPNNYYLQVEPLLQGVTVSYVLDGSDTMSAKRNYVNNSLSTFIASLKSLFGANSAVNAHIYILKDSQSASLCGQFYSSAGVTCEDIGGAPLYTALKKRGISPPFPAPYRSYDEWKAGTHITADYDFSQSDWASGVMYASIMHNENEAEKSTSNRHIIVTVADELPTTSKADECFGIKENPAEPSFVSSNDLLFCYMCNATIPVNRSRRMINQTAQLLEDNGDMFIGFNSFACDYSYYTPLNDFAVSNYSCRYLDNFAAKCSNFDAPGDGGGGGGFGGGGGGGPVDTVYPPADANWCEQGRCGACKRSPTSPWDGKYCFHREGDLLIVSQQQQLADVSGGKVLALTNLSLLTTSIEKYFQNLIQAFNFKIGVRDETRDRYVVDQDITFAHGEKVHLTLWLYDTAQKGPLCEDNRTDLEVCSGERVSCGFVNDTCGSGRQCTNCVECTTTADCNAPATACCANHCVNANTDSSNCGTCGTVCAPPQYCDAGACKASASVVVPVAAAPVSSEPADMVNNACKSFWKSSGWEAPFSVMQDDGYLLTAQTIDSGFPCGGGTGNGLALYPVVFDIANDPLHPVKDARTGFWSARPDWCHSPFKYQSFTVSSDLKYQALGTTECGSSTEGLYVVAPDLPTRGHRVIRNPILYSFANYGAEHYLIGVPGANLYLDGVSCGVSPPGLGAQFCNALFADWPSARPAPDTFYRGWKAVFGDNIVQINDSGAIELYSLASPSRLQAVQLPSALSPPPGPKMQFEGPGGGTILYGKSSSGKYIVVADDPFGYPAKPDHNIQIFRLVGSGATATLENVTTALVIPGGWLRGGIITLKGKTMLMEMRMTILDGSPVYDFHTYSFEDLGNGVVRDIGAGLPKMTDVAVYEASAPSTIPLGTYDKGDDSYLYLNVNNSMSIYKITG